MSTLPSLPRAGSKDHLHHLVGLLKGHILGFPHSRPSDSEALGLDPETCPPPQILMCTNAGEPLQLRWSNLYLCDLLSQCSH